MTLKKNILLSAAAAALLFLSACSGASAGTNATVVVSDAVEDADVSVEIGDQGFASEVVDGVVVIDTAGSSTCPPTIEKGTFKDGVLTLERSTYGDNPCTMDYRLFRQEVSLTDGAKFDADVTVKVAE